MSRARRYLVRNVAANVLSLGVGIGVGLWQVPFLLRHFRAAYGGDLGIAAYGQIGVLRSLTDYALLAAFAFTSTISRFMAIRLNRGDSAGAQVCFSSALVALLGLCGTAVVAAVAVLPRVGGWVGAPLPLREDFGRLFSLMMLASSLTALNSPFMSVPFARHRFDLINFFKVTGLGIQVGLLVLLFSRWRAGLALVGVAYLVKEAWTLAGAVWMSRKMAPFLRVSVVAADRRTMWEMAGMSFWSAVGRLGFLLYFSIDLVVINRLLGGTACGRYAPIAQLALLVSLFSGAVANVFWPIAYEHIARDRMDALVSHVQRTTKLLGLTVGLPVALLCGLGGPLLTVWLHDASWAAYAPLLVILLAPALWTFSLKHLFSLTHGLNRVRVPAWVTLGGGLLNLGLSVFLVRYTPLGMYGIAVATGLALTFRNVVIMPAYVGRVTGRPAGAYRKGLGAVVAASAGTAALGAAAAHWLFLSTLPRLACAVLALSAVHLLFSRLALDEDDVRFVASLFRRKESAS